jgi:hypothetical protein
MTGRGEGRTRPFARPAEAGRVAADAIALERAVADAPLASFPIHDVKQRSLLASRRVPASGLFASISAFGSSATPHQ